MKAKKEKTELNDKEVDEALKRVQESMAQYKPVDDRASEIGDFLIADYTVTCEGNEIEKRNDDWIELQGENEFIKGFSKALVGMKPEEEKEVTLDLPAEFAKKELAGKPATFKVKVKDIYWDQNDL